MHLIDVPMILALCIAVLVYALWLGIQWLHSY